jgi:hypothetical protein
MTDKDREAFEGDCANNEVYVGCHHKHPEQYQLYETQLRWMGWQAARDNYAPNLTETEATKIAAMVCAEIDYDEDYHAEFEDVGLFIAQNWNSYSETARAIVKALRAAGLRFKRDA